MTIKTIPDFVYHAPETVREVVGLLDVFKSKAKILAGGTDLIPKMKGGVVAPEHVISLKGVNKLHFSGFDDENGLCFGSMVTLRELESMGVVTEVYPALYQGINTIASTQIRNAATLVGNICNAVPSADSAPALLVLDAQIKLVSVYGERWVPIQEFFTGVCKTVVAENELVTEVRIPVPPPGSRNVYYPFTSRKAMDLAMVGVAAAITAKDGICQDAKIALGAVAVTPVRAKKTESLLVGQPFSKELIEKAALCASTEECCPISDLRASQAYRRAMIRVLTRDSLGETWER